jgi:hypothetical protein
LALQTKLYQSLQAELCQSLQAELCQSLQLEFFTKKALGEGARFLFASFEDLFNNFGRGLEDAVFRRKMEANAAMKLGSAV